MICFRHVFSPSLRLVDPVIAADKRMRPSGVLRVEVYDEYAVRAGLQYTLGGQGNTVKCAEPHACVMRRMVLTTRQ
jgi:hypothetical protein